MCECAFVLSRLDHWNSLLAGCPKYLLYKNSKKYRTILQDSYGEPPDLPTSLLCFILFTGYLLGRGSNTSCLCVALRSFLTRSPSTFQNFFTFTLTPSRQLRSSTDTRVFRITSSEQSSMAMQSSFSYQAPVIWNTTPCFCP